MSTQRWMLSVLLILALLAPCAVAPAPAQAGGGVTVCDEAHLLAALAGGGTVTFACSGTITLTSTITIATDTTIDGSGQSVTISGNHAVRVFTVNSGVTLDLNGLTITNGHTTDNGGGIYNDGGMVTLSNSTFSGNYGGIGGGICNGDGTLAVNNSTFSGNSGSSFGGGIYNDIGAVTVSNSTFSDNWGGSGGGIGNRDGTVNVINSTFSGNRATYGGGISNAGALTVSNSTFSGNRATYGGGINRAIGSTVTLSNTIVANSSTGGNCSGFITDGGGNLSYPDTTCPGINADPLLGQLQNNGGPTWTMEPGPGSAAIDAGIDAICAAPPVNNLDQRGITRPAGAHCDIGAVERLAFRKWLPTILSQ